MSQTPPPEPPPSDLEATVAAQAELLAKYRRFIGKLATNRSKDNAWYTAKAWAPQDFWWAIGADLESEEEQQAFLFH
ncbi:MAG: hypothetical protein EOP88_21135 [Verrucomicrobiaceae bacterium]|nr:MAG: hypothetical protein EOP88_21135 [Verrucomicrobiaceae bacterium]